MGRETLAAVPDRTLNRLKKIVEETSLQGYLKISFECPTKFVDYVKEGVTIDETGIRYSGSNFHLTNEDLVRVLKLENQDLNLAAQKLPKIILRSASTVEHKDIPCPNLKTWVVKMHQRVFMRSNALKMQNRELQVLMRIRRHPEQMLVWWKLGITQALKRTSDKHDEQVQRGQRVCAYLLYGSGVQITTSSDGRYVACSSADHVQQRYREEVRETTEQVIQELLGRGGPELEEDGKAIVDEPAEDTSLTMEECNWVRKILEREEPKGNSNCVQNLIEARKALLATFQSYLAIETELDNLSLARKTELKELSLAKKIELENLSLAKNIELQKLRMEKDVEMEKFTTDLRVMNEEKDDVRKELDGKKVELEQKDGTIKKLEEDRESVNSKLVASEQKVEKLHEVVRTQEGQVVEAQSFSKKIQELLAAEKKTTASLNERLKASQLNVNNLIMERDTAKEESKNGAEVVGLRSKVSDLQTIIARKNEDIESWREQVQLTDYGTPESREHLLNGATKKRKRHCSPLILLQEKSVAKVEDEVTKRMLGKFESRYREGLAEGFTTQQSVEVVLKDSMAKFIETFCAKNGPAEWMYHMNANAITLLKVVLGMTQFKLSDEQCLQLWENLPELTRGFVPRMVLDGRLEAANPEIFNRLAGGLRKLHESYLVKMQEWVSKGEGKQPCFPGNLWKS